MTDPMPSPSSDPASRPLPSGCCARYDRRRDLPRLVALWPHELEDGSPEAHARLVAILRRALRIERRLALAGHFSYDLARHRALLAATRHEQDLLARRRAESPE